MTCRFWSGKAKGDTFFMASADIRPRGVSGTGGGREGGWISFHRSPMGID